MPTIVSPKKKTALNSTHVTRALVSVMPRRSKKYTSLLVMYILRVLALMPRARQKEALPNVTRGLLLVTLGNVHPRIGAKEMALSRMVGAVRQMTIVKTLAMVSSVVNLGNPMSLTVSFHVISCKKVFKRHIYGTSGYGLRGIGGVIYGSINLESLLCDQ